MCFKIEFICVQNREVSYVHPVFAILPDVVCRSPQESLAKYRNIAEESGNFIILALLQIERAHFASYIDHEYDKQ